MFDTLRFDLLSVRMLYQKTSMEKSLQILAATTNPNKLRELQTIAREFAIAILSPNDIIKRFRLGPIPSVDESGSTYRENALLKAKAYSDWSGLNALGDDSGLEVLALGNRPGLLSARYVGDDATDEERIQKLLGELHELEKSSQKAVDRTAYYRCSLALVFRDALAVRDCSVTYVDSSLPGKILSTPRGNKGFGYDPIVYLPSLGKTLAEVDFQITCTHGFRALAARNLFQSLISVTLS